jgi:type III restriction enzyme
VEYDFAFVDQEGFEKYKPKSFRETLGGFREYNP